MNQKKMNSINNMQHIFICSHNECYNQPRKGKKFCGNHLNIKTRCHSHLCNNTFKKRTHLRFCHIHKGSSIGYNPRHMCKYKSKEGIQCFNYRKHNRDACKLHKGIYYKYTYPVSEEVMKKTYMEFEKEFCKNYLVPHESIHMDTYFKVASFYLKEMLNEDIKK
jgi:hypothetical protein